MKKILLFIMLFFSILPYIHQGSIQLNVAEKLFAQAQYPGSEENPTTICGHRTEDIIEDDEAWTVKEVCYSTVDCITGELTGDGQNNPDCILVYVLKDLPLPGDTTGTGGGGTGGGGGGGGTITPMNMIKCGSFNDIISMVLHTEGGYVNNSNDPGGATNHGISWPTWQDAAEPYLSEQPTLNNLINLTEDQAKTIYKGMYWDAVKADQINDGDLRYLVVDFYINSRTNAIIVLQRTLNQLGANVSVDGVMGSQTITAINQADPVSLYNTYISNRQEYYNYLCISPTINPKRRNQNSTFINGWTNRVNSFKKKTTTNKYNVNCK